MDIIVFLLWFVFCLLVLSSLSRIATAVEQIARTAGPGPTPTEERPRTEPTR